MSLIQAADDSSNADNSVHIRFILDSSNISSSRAFAGVNDSPGLLSADLFDRDANLTFQYYILATVTRAEPCESCNILDASVELFHFERSRQTVSGLPVDIHDIVLQILYCSGSDNTPVPRAHNNYRVVQKPCRIMSR